MRPDRGSAGRSKGAGRRLACAFGILVTLAGAACKDNMFTGNLTPVPPAHRLPADVGGAVVLLDTDPVIETRDPNHVFRAKEQRVPEQYRASMERALVLSGFRVTRRSDERHDFRAKLAIAVTEYSDDDIRQVYRCGLTAPEGTLVAQIDWAWPKGTFVEINEVFDFATHNIATEIATSRRVLEWLRAHRQAPPVEPDAGPLSP